jgi:hypothetical protein
MVFIFSENVKTEENLLLFNIDNGVTFKFNKDASIHRTYPYVEGFSGDFVRRKIK